MGLDVPGLNKALRRYNRSLPMSQSQEQPVNGFAKFDLHPNIMRGIQNAGFTEPRPIQAKTLPAALAGDDILGLAQTGTGKTAGFAIPILERIARDPCEGPTALILAPTRELAAQIADEIRTLASCTRIKGITIYGGVGQRPQVAGLRQRPDIIVACPGRLLDLIGQGFVKLGHVQTLVLDEADHMFDMGFLVSIRKILKHLPRKRQNLLFSATMPKEIRHLADEMLDDPTVVELENKKPIDLIEQVVYPVHHRRKVRLTEHILRTDDVSRAIIFTRTKRGAKALADKLDRANFNAAALQGNMSQNARERVMRGFKSGKLDIHVATDIAARGIDVSKVSHVINYDVPDTPEAYTHRIGRTGRAECTGKACTFITSEDRSMLRAIERRIDQDIPQNILEEFIHCDDPDPRNRATKPSNSGRRSHNRGNSRDQRSNASGRGQSSKPARKRKPDENNSDRPRSNTNGKPARANSETSADAPKRLKPKAKAPANRDGEPRAQKAKPARNPRPGNKPAAGGNRPPKKRNKPGQSASVGNRRTRPSS